MGLKQVGPEPFIDASEAARDQEAGRGSSNPDASPITQKVPIATDLEPVALSGRGRRAAIATAEPATRRRLGDPIEERGDSGGGHEEGSSPASEDRVPEEYI